MANRRFLFNLVPKIRDIVAYETTKGLTGLEQKQCSTKIKQLFDYTMIGEKCGKFARSDLALSTYRILTPSTSLEDEEMTAAAKDDFLDCFGDPKITGKDSTDLLEGKCTWIICSFIENIKDKPHEKQLFQQKFGNSDHVDEIKKLIVDNRIRENFLKFQKEAVDDLKRDISNFPVAELRPLLDEAVDLIVNRKK